MRLRVSGSPDPGEIACNLMMLSADMLFVGIRYAHRILEMRQSARVINV